MNTRSIISILSLALVTVVFASTAMADARLAKKSGNSTHGLWSPPTFSRRMNVRWGSGWAYAQAEDHMVTIMKLIIRARGESAKYLGATESNINTDFWNRQYRIHARAKETFNDLDRDWQEMTEGFAEGLNYYIELHRDELPDFVSACYEV